MAASFKFLSFSEFEGLGSPEKLAYLTHAIVELQRTGRAGDVHGWDNLFAQTVTQQQQQAQTQPQRDAEPPQPK